MNLMKMHLFASKFKSVPQEIRLTFNYSVSYFEEMFISMPENATHFD